MIGALASVHLKVHQFPRSEKFCCLREPLKTMKAAHLPNDLSYKHNYWPK